MKWIKHPIRPSTMVADDYSIEKDHSRLGRYWRVRYRGEVIAGAMTQRAAREAAEMHAAKILRTVN